MTNDQRKERVRELRLRGSIVIVEDEYKTTVCDFKYGNTIAIGVAVCGPNDRYNRQIGRRIAIGRAIKEWMKVTNDEPQFPEVEIPF